MSLDRGAASKGALQRAREQLGFLERGNDVLKMKRDQLAGDLNALLRELESRESVESLFEDAFRAARASFAELGYDRFASMAETVTPMEVQALPISSVGVIIPDIRVTVVPKAEEVPSQSLMKTATKLARALKEGIALGVLETKVEQLARELMETNRKVNALEKVVIPRYRATIRYIEERLSEQALQEFFVTKRMRDITREGRERSKT